MELINNHILTILIAFPVVVSFVFLIIPREEKKLLMYLAGLSALVEFIFSLHLYFYFKNTGSFEFIEIKPWILTWKINYFVGVDGVSLFLVLLITFLMPLVLWSACSSIKVRVKEFVVSMLILESSMIGVFCALDLFLFYVFWEVMLVPMYLLIGVWGGKNRIYATIKFFLYTMAGSVLMLVAILFLYYQGGNTFNLVELYEHTLGFTAQLWLFLAFALAFAIKVPLFPFHTWLPDAHVEAPTSGSVILAGVLLKMGTYGFFRFAMPLFPEAFDLLKPYLVILAVIGIVYGALVAMVQTDMKKLIAYSSVSHLGLVMLGLFSLNPTGMQGALYQMLNHGISTGVLFLLVGVLYDRTHSREISLYGGIAKAMPIYATFFLLATMASIGLPLTNGFVGEFLTLAGSFQTIQIPTIIGATGIVLSAVYMLWLVERVFFGKLKTPGGQTLLDITRQEFLILLPFIILIFWMGIYPKPFLSKMNRPIENLLIQLAPEQTEEGPVQIHEEIHMR